MASSVVQGLHFCSPPSILSSSRSKTHVTTPLSRTSLSRPLSMGKRVVVAASIERVGLDENPEGIISGEWPENFSLLSYEDLRAYLEPEILKEEIQPSALLGEVMATVIRTAMADNKLGEIDHHFEFVSGLPVVDEELVCIGIVSKEDRARASDGLQSTVGEVMSTSVITLSPDKTVLDAATLMLRERIHRIPIVNERGQVIGMVTRSDIFKVLKDILR
ncbi:uncharacterized protein LOC116253634 [Nymphaea colorata]|nr:uncharacterized protein LOC116253634 [Nymphaea colorata]